MAQLYWGKEEITGVLDAVTKGNKRVSTASGSFDVPEWELTAVTTEAPTDESEVRNRRGNYVVSEVLKLLHQLDVRTEEIGFYIQKLIASLQQNEEIAIAKALGFIPESYDFNIQAMKNDVRMSTLDNILKS